MGAEDVDALDFLDPEPIMIQLNGVGVEVERLGLADWLRYESLELDALRHSLSLKFSEAIDAWVSLVEYASSVSLTEVTVSDALDALRLVANGQKIQYIDPAFQEAMERETQKVLRESTRIITPKGPQIERRYILDIAMVVARRFPIADILKMRPEMLFFAYQTILNDEATDRTVAYYMSDFGYDKKHVGKGKTAKIKMKPRKSPYLTPWQKIADKHRRGAVVSKEEEAVESPFVMHPDKIVDLKSR